MRARDVAVGNRYHAKVSGSLTVVRIDAPCSLGGWCATNVATGRKVRIKSAARLRGAA